MSLQKTAAPAYPAQIRMRSGASARQHKENLSEIKFNTMSRVEYLALNLLFGVLIWFFNMRNGIYAVNGISETAGKTALTACAAVSVAGGVLLTFHIRRTYMSLVGNIILPYIPFVILTSPLGVNTFLLWTASLAAIFVLVFSLFKLVQRFREGTRLSAVRLFQHYFICARNFTAAVFLFTFCVLYATPLHSMLRQAAFQPAARYSVEDVSDKLAVFEKTRWNSANEQERLEALQALADVETTSLSLPDALTVDQKELSPNVLACYEDKTRTIHYNSSKIMDISNVNAFHSMLHECCHAQQFRMLDAYRSMSEEQQALSAFSHIAKYREEAENYHGAEEDKEAYSSQQLEIDADEYADTRILQYIAYIDFTK